MADQDITILGIESSCDETAAAVVRMTTDGQGLILSNIVHTQLAEHAPFGGVVPELAARAHVEKLDSLVSKAMQESGLGFHQLNGIAVTSGPGLLGGLMSGVMTAKGLSLVHHLPLIGVNHLEGHALTPGLTNNISPPYLLLLVSGGHTQILDVAGPGDYRRLGTTIDDAVGEAFDKTAKMLGLGYPGGPEVEKWALKGNANRFSFPLPLKNRKEPHFSFSGLKTAVRRTAQKMEPVSDQDIADICASFQHTVGQIIMNRMARAMAIYQEEKTGDNTLKLVISGGVAANKGIIHALGKLCEEEGFELIAPPMKFCTDNAAMIAWAGAIKFKAGHTNSLNLACQARWPLDPDAPVASLHGKN